MTEQNLQIESEQIEPQPTEPHGAEGGETDWKAESRKWETRSKENKEKAEGLEAANATLQADLEAAKKRAKEAEKLAAELQKASDARNWADEASKLTGVPAAVLRGSTLEEMIEHGKLIRGSISLHPLVNDNGEPPTPTLTKDEILKIEDPKERKAAIKANLELF